LEAADAGVAGWLFEAWDVELDGFRREKAVCRNEGGSLVLESPGKLKLTESKMLLSLQFFLESRFVAQYL
jgi:hypothetical protein